MHGFFDLWDKCVLTVISLEASPSHCTERESGEAHGFRSIVTHIRATCMRFGGNFEPRTCGFSLLFCDNGPENLSTCTKLVPVECVTG